MEYTIFDIEADELYDKVTLVHCLSWWKSDGTSGTIIGDAQIKYFLSQQKILIGHNIKRYDNPVILKILGYEILSRCIDTLALSWYLFPQMKKHGLEVWGEILGVAKPVIEDWSANNIESIVVRCETDVVINTKLFHKQLALLKRIYAGQDLNPIMNYLTYKLDCAAEQEQVRIKVNREHCQEMLNILDPMIEERLSLLSSQMPRVIKTKDYPKPASHRIYKRDGQLSVAGIKWFERLFDNGKPADFEGPLTLVDSDEPANAGSVIQLKKWLFGLGWQPTLFKHEKDKDGKPKKTPQISQDGNICLNIQSMYEKHPELENLEGLFMLKHRQGVFKGFLESADENGYMKAEIEGFTNTLRFKHRKPIANLPGVNKPYGKEIRGAIIAPEGYIFCGSDMSSLEDTTKQHYIYYYDPEYVKTMRVPGFDPHIDIGLLAKMLDEYQCERFKILDKIKSEDLIPEEKAEFSVLKKIRGKAKVVNFSGVYGAGPPKISLTTGMSLQEATLLHTIYWERNKAVKQIAKDVTVRCLLKDGTHQDYLGSQLMYNKGLMANISQMWLYNPVSKFYYSLRYPKDIFSTLNQGTGVFCFDTWVRKVRRGGLIKIGLQYHDEIGFALLENDKQAVTESINQAIKETNEELNLNIPLGVSIDFGLNYAECH